MNENAIDRNLVCAFIDGLISDDGERKKGLEYIRNMPSVNPQEPTDTWSIKDVADNLARHGLIVEQEPKTGHRLYNDIYDHYLCENCKTIVMDYDNFCPNCGCRMVEPQERSDKV